MNVSPSEHERECVCKHVPKSEHERVRECAPKSENANVNVKWQLSASVENHRTSVFVTFFSKSHSTRCYRRFLQFA